jgi:hypothetical protein
VAGVREQRQRVGQQSANHFDQQEGCRYEQGYRQRALIGMTMPMAVMF